MIGILARKQMMTRITTPEGKVLVVTLLKAPPQLVTLVKSKERDGYEAIQLGLGKGRMKKPQKEALKDLGEFKILKEIPGRGGEIKRGEQVTVEIFTPGEMVKVSGTAKGKGFAGTVKRHGFHRGPQTHGHDHHRAPGSIGAMGMARVMKGMKMAGRMGGQKITLKKVQVVAVDPKENLLLVRGSVPGNRNNLVIISKVTK